MLSLWPLIFFEGMDILLQIEEKLTARKDTDTMALTDFSPRVDAGNAEYAMRPIITLTTKENTRAAIDGLAERLRASSGYSYDFETLVIPWWHKNWKPLAIGFSTDGETAWTVPLFHRQSPLRREDIVYFLQQITPIMADPTIPKSAHNSLFDDLCWFRLTGVLPHCSLDTMVVAHLLDENRQKGLKYLGRSLLGFPNWDVDAKKDHELTTLMTYLAGDVKATWQLRQRFIAELKEQPRLWDYHNRLEAPKIRALERLIARGIYVDRERLEERCHTATTQRADVLGAIPVDNPASTPQLKTWLYSDLKLTPPHLTPKGAPSTDEESILRLCQRYPEHQGIRKLLEWRKWNKFLSTYLSPVSVSLGNSFDGRIHPEYRSTSVETGRLGSSFHTTPRDNFIRSIYTAPPGSSLVSADYSQIEARLAAWAAAGKPAIVSTASTMLGAWFTNRDVYVEQAAAILGKRPDQVTRDPKDPQNERQMLGKVPVLSMLYAISPKGLQEYVWREYEIDWTRAQAQECWDGFYKLWPEFRRWHELMRIKIETDGGVVSEIGRVRRLPAALYGDFRAKDEAIRSGINAPIQSLASDILQTAAILLDQQGYQVVGSIHDAVLIEEPDLTRVEQIRQVMEAAHLALRPLGLRLPHGLIRVEIKAGSWGEGKEIPVQVKGLDLAPAALVP